MRTRSFLLVFGLLLAAVLPVGAQGVNLLQDPGFEGEVYSRVSADANDPATTFNAPTYWWGGLILGGDAPWKNVHPNGFPHTGGVKRSGGRSYHMSRGGGTFTAWLLQQVSVVPNTDVQGGGWALIENSAGGSIVRAGIDPTGGTDPNSPTVVWSDWAGALYQWNLVQVTARAGATGVVTLFLYATQNQPADPNGVYWDDAFLNGTPGAGLNPNPGGQPAPAAARVVSSTDRVNVRSGPGLDAARIGTLRPGDAYTVIGESNGWYSIDFNGQTGWVSAIFVTVSEGQPTVAGGVAPAPSVPSIASLRFLVDYTLRMRAAPDTTSAILASIPHNTTVTATGRSADGRWLQVTYQGQTGWIAAQYGRARGGDILGLPVTG
ncbi:MAG: SH3 domain-containing protein [Chloroflexi bacterium]|nr:SH3 domain-containing protein [Chloroflexota bacterium]